MLHVLLHCSGRRYALEEGGGGVGGKVGGLNLFGWFLKVQNGNTT